MTSAASLAPTSAAIRKATSTVRPTVCQLVHGLPVGGAEVLIDRLVRQLRDRFDVIVTCLDDVGQLGEALRKEGLRVTSLGRRPGFDWRCVRKLQQLFRDEQVQLVHAHQCTPFAYALATRMFGQRPPILLTEHGRFFPDLPSTKRKYFHRLLSRREDRFMAVGETVRQALVENEGLPAGRVEVVYNGINFNAVDRQAGEREHVRTELGCRRDDFVVLQVARLDVIKDHSTALRALELAAKRNSRVRLFIVGDGPERSAIEREIVSRSLQKHATLLGLRNDVSRLLTAADLFLLTSVSEGIPVTILEAMAAEVAVVATNVGGVPEVIKDGENGLLPSAGDAPAIAEAIVRLSDDPELRSRLASAGRERARQHFSETRMIADYERIYGEMLAGRAK